MKSNETKTNESTSRAVANRIVGKNSISLPAKNVESERGEKENDYSVQSLNNQNLFRTEAIGLESNHSVKPLQKKKEDMGGNLPDEIQMKMENSFETDFSDVKVYENSSTAKNLNALAYTQGNEIHFAPEQNPYSGSGQKILAHELVHVQQQREDRVNPMYQEQGFNVNDDNRLENEASILGSKALAGEKVGSSRINTTNTINHAVQKKSNSPIQKYSSLPGGAIIRTIQPNMSNIYAACAYLANRVHGGAASNINWALRIGPQVEAPLLANTLPPLSIPFTESSGIDWDWTVNINWRINNPQVSGGPQSSQVTRGFGGSTQVTTGTSTSRTDSAEATVGTGERKSGAEGSVTAGTSTTTSSSSQQQVTLTGGGTSQAQEQTQNYTAELVASITVQGSANFSGSDYINPFKWGYAGADAVANPGPQSGDYSGGTISYSMPNP